MLAKDTRGRRNLSGNFRPSSACVLRLWYKKLQVEDGLACEWFEKKGEYKLSPESQPANWHANGLFVLKRQSDGSWKGSWSLLTSNDCGHIQFSGGREPKLLQLRVLRLGLLEDGDVRVGVFPEREEILIGGFCLGGVTLHGVRSAKLEMRQSADGLILDDTRMVKNFLELGRGFGTLVPTEICLTSHEDGIQGAHAHAA
jgi:hypothetical protein